MVNRFSVVSQFDFEIGKTDDSIDSRAVSEKWVLSCISLMFINECVQLSLIVMCYMYGMFQVYFTYQTCFNGHTRMTRRATCALHTIVAFLSLGILVSCVK